MAKQIPLITIPSSNEGELVYGILEPTGTLGQLHFASQGDNNTALIGLEVEPGHEVKVIREDFQNGLAVLRIYVTRK